MTNYAKHVFDLTPECLRRLARMTVLSVGLTVASLPAGAGAHAPTSPPADPKEVLEAVVGIDSRIPASARTAPALGTQREGSGVVIADDGLVLTIGYLILEAIEIDIALADGRRIPASFVAYDHESGFGLVRAASDLGLEPVRLGTSDGMGVSTQVLLANRLGPDSAQGVFVVDRREFAGAWEYLLDDAIFTSPPNPNFSGAGLFDADGKLIGIGSLFVGNAAFFQRPVAGNMFVPIDELKPILDEMIDSGRRAATPRPWLGIRTSELRDRLFVDGVSDESPAARAGVRAGDLVVAVDDAPVGTMAGYFRAIWRGRIAGDTVTVRVLTPEGVLRDIEIESMDRYNWLRLDPSL